MKHSFLPCIVFTITPLIYSMNQPYPQYYTPDFKLLHAVRTNNTTAVKYLLKNNFRENITDEDKQLALYTAVQQGSFFMVKMLVDYGVRPTRFFAQNTAFTLALQLAIESMEDSFAIPSYNSYKTIIKLFLSLPDLAINVNCSNLSSALELIIETQDTELLQLILKHRHFNLSEVPAALTQAVKTQNLALVELLLKSQGCIDNYEDEYGCTSLDYAVSNNNYHMAKLLIKASTRNVNLKTSSAMRPLLDTACINENHTLAVLLLNAGADYICRDSCNTTLLERLHQTALSNLITLVSDVELACPNFSQYLYQHNAYTPFAQHLLDAKEHDTTSSCCDRFLTSSKSFGQTGTLLKLIKTYITSNLPQDEAADFTKSLTKLYNYKKLLDTLEKYIQFSRLLPQAIVHGKSKIVKSMLMLAPGLIYLTDASDNTLLHIAVTTGNSEIIEYILSCKPSLICVKNTAGKTPFELAIGLHNAALIPLLSSAARPNAKL